MSNKSHVCKCIDCPCTSLDNHCGCLSEKGCTCTFENNCGCLSDGCNCTKSECPCLKNTDKGKKLERNLHGHIISDPLTPFEGEKKLKFPPHPIGDPHLPGADL